jgi:hypothetical protein
MVKWHELKPLDSTSRAARWRHAGWAANRQRVYDALIATHRSEARINAFATCGCNAVLLESDTLPVTYKISATNCHDRLCVPCGNARAAEIARCLAARTDGKELKFITLTIAGHGKSLSDKLNMLYKGFRSLRQTPLWQSSIHGGAAFLEIKWSDKAHRWHPHFHLICEGRFIPQDKLSTLWHAITQDSFIVDVQAVRDPNEVHKYVTKYASKPLNMSFVCDPSLLQEALTSLHGRRLCFAFGTWYKTRLHEVDAPDEPREGYTPIYSLEQIIAAAEAGDKDALFLLHLPQFERHWRHYLFPPAAS